jgi:hypothetical protein
VVVVPDDYLSGFISVQVQTRRSIDWFTLHVSRCLLTLGYGVLGTYWGTPVHQPFPW